MAVMSPVDIPNEVLVAFLARTYCCSKSSWRFVRKAAASRRSCARSAVYGCSDITTGGNNVPVKTNRAAPCGARNS